LPTPTRRVCQAQAAAVVLADVRPFAHRNQPLAGPRFRCMLGRHIFAHIGAGVKIYHGVDLTYGYNLTIEDGVTIRQRALLNDRGGIAIGKGAVIGSFARIYSHTHSPENYDQVTLVPTIIGPAPASAATPSSWPASTLPPAKPSAASPSTVSERRGEVRPCSPRRIHPAMHYKAVKIVAQ
jgi:hypothetical protein